MESLITKYNITHNPNISQVSNQLRTFLQTRHILELSEPLDIPFTDEQLRDIFCYEGQNVKMIIDRSEEKYSTQEFQELYSRYNEYTKLQYQKLLAAKIIIGLNNIKPLDNYEMLRIINRFIKWELWIDDTFVDNYLNYVVNRIQLV